MNLIKIGNLILNISQLIEAEYTPASRGVHEDTGQKFSRAAKLTMRFSAPDSEPHTDYEGNYTGFAIVSPYCRTLHGEDAEAVWRELAEHRRA